MARLFDDASSEYLEVVAAPVTAAPLTFAAWVNTDDDSTEQAVLSVLDSSASNYFYLYVYNKRIYFRTKSAAANQTAFTGPNTVSANTWHHIAGTSSSDSNRVAWIDGSSGGANTSSVTPSGVDRTAIARRGSVVPRHLSGSVAEAAIWNVVLSSDEIGALAHGVSPAHIRPASLLFYARLLRTDQDLVGGNDLTAYNTPSWTDHPPTASPAWYRRRGTFAAAAAGGVTVTPGALTSVAASVAPTVVLGDVTITPSALAAIAASVAPTVVLGSITVGPAARTAVAASIDPSVLISGGGTVPLMMAHYRQRRT